MIGRMRLCGVSVTIHLLSSIQIQDWMMTVSTAVQVTFQAQACLLYLLPVLQVAYTGKLSSDSITLTYSIKKAKKLRLSFVSK